MYQEKNKAFKPAESRHYRAKVVDIQMKVSEDVDKGKLVETVSRALREATQKGY